MQVQRVGGRNATPGGGGVPAGAFNWGTIYQFDDKEAGRIKCAALDSGDIYTGSQSDGVRRWSVVTGG
jgi:hypothetical protein